MRARSLVAIVTVGACALGACAMVDGMSGVSEARALQASGQSAEALILEIWDTGITVNNDPVIGLRVEVHSADRPPYEARIPKSLVSRVHIPQFQPGCRVAVKFDPLDPSKVALDVYKY